MGEVVTFVGYQPPARFDGTAWTEARIDEAADEAGAYVLVDTLTLFPVDSDPAHPAVRSFTTTLGTAPDYWYQVVYADADGGTSHPTAAAEAVGGIVLPAVTPYTTVAELFRVVTISNPTAAQTTAGDRVVLTAAGEINSEIGGTPSLTGWRLALAAEVNLERAVEHWQQQEAPSGIIGLGEAGIAYTARDSWDRHAHKLAPLKQEWALA